MYLSKVVKFLLHRFRKKKSLKKTIRTFPKISKGHIQVRIYCSSLFLLQHLHSTMSIRHKHNESYTKHQCKENETNRSEKHIIYNNQTLFITGSLSFLLLFNIFPTNIFPLSPFIHSIPSTIGDRVKKQFESKSTRKNGGSEYGCATEKSVVNAGG
jgi:hypothetical protein